MATDLTSIIDVITPINPQIRMRSRGVCRLVLNRYPVINMIKKLLVTLLCSLGVFCLHAEPEKSSEGATSKTEKNPPAFDPKNMDTSVKPARRFLTYANGTWLKNTPIPPE